MIENQNQDLVSFTGGYQGTTNVRTLKMLYSLKKHKFISPFKTSGDRVVGDIEYRVFPSDYLVLAAWKQRERYEFRVSLIRISKETTDNLKSVNIFFNHESYVNDSQVALDFVQAMPGYHFIRHESLFKKIYSEKDTAILMKFLELYDGQEFSEEGETE